jgi:hypothetical protein
MATTLTEKQWRELREAFARVGQLTGELERAVEALERELGKVESDVGRIREEGDDAVD